MNNTLKARIVHKHELERDWKEAINFIPLQGEIIVYIPDSTHSYSRLKIGDGKTLINDLPFYGEKKELVWGDFTNDTISSSSIAWGKF